MNAFSQVLKQIDKIPDHTCLLIIDNSLVVSQISSVGGGFCVFTGINGSSTVVYGDETVDVTPPQVQIRGDCDLG